MYVQSGVMVDWALVPEASARRPPASRLLFQRVEVPLVLPPAPPSQEQRAKAASDTVAFFWMMAAVTAKYIVRGDSVFVVGWLERLAGLVNEVERQVEREASMYRRGSTTIELPATNTEHLASLRLLCRRVDELSPSVAALGGEIWPSAAEGVERWLSMVAAD